MDAFLLEADLGARLDPRRDLAAYSAIECGQHRLSAQYRRGIGNLRGSVEVQAVSGVLAVRIDVDLDQKVSLLAVRARHAASAETDLLAFLDSGRDLDFKCREGRFASRRRRILKLDPLGGAESRVTEAHCQGACHIQGLLPGRAPAAVGLPAEGIVVEAAETEAAEARTAGPPAAGSARAAENIAEHAAEQVLRVLSAEVEGLIAAGSAGAVVLVTAGSARSAAWRRTARAVKSSIAISVIKFPFFRITQDRIGFSDILKLLLRVLIAGIRVRVVLLGKFPVCGFQFLIISRAVHAEHCV